MRPEAWALAGLYTLYLWRGATARERATYAGLTALAPVLWALGDWAVTGDPLHSLHGTADLAETVDRRRDPLTGPYWAAKYLGYTLREPMVIGIPIGLAFAWRHARAPSVAAVRGRGGDARRLPDQPAVRAAADRPLRPHARRCCSPSTTGSRCSAGRCCRATSRSAAVDHRSRGVAVLASVVYLPWHAKQLSGLETASTTRAPTTATCARSASRPRSAPRLERCEVDRHRRPPPDPPPALVDRERPGLGRAGRRGGRPPRPRSSCSRAARRRCAASTARSSRACARPPASSPSTATRRGGCWARASARRAEHLPPGG